MSQDKNRKKIKINLPQVLINAKDTIKFGGHFRQGSKDQKPGDKFEVYRFSYL
jgi:hypothetical protein